MSTKGNQQQPPLPKKCSKSGHEKTKRAICLICYKESKRNARKSYCFSQYNKSTMTSHMKIHKDVLANDYSKYFVQENDLKALKAVKELAQLQGCSTYVTSYCSNNLHALGV